ncbi:MAG: hypothetical protein Q7S35_03315 [Candidatus Limnocylindrales bacterium]|nr:hypothetical protein [Candidatus Limnocylindrales bacterium]
MIGVLAAALTLAATSPVSAHGGVATLQLGSERINPGGTLEVVGDMTTDGSIALILIADADGAARPMATLAAGDDGHFQAFVVIPGDVPEGSYTVSAGNGVDLTRAPIVIAGVRVPEGEQGQLPGQDEALAGALPSGVAQATRPELP